MTPLPLCLFGAGEMATTHAMNLAADPRVRIAYVVDPSAERAGALAAAIGARVTDAETALADQTIAGHIIASPPRTHADLLDRASQTSARIFCEKPIDHDISRARACLRAYRGREAMVQMGFNRRFDAQFIAAKAAITQGRIGTPEQALIISRDAEAPPVEGFQHSSGLLKETAVHDFDLVRWLFEDEVAEVFVMADALINPDYLSVGQVDTTTTLLRMARGTHVTILNSLRAAFGYDQRLEVMGPLGQVSVNNVPQSQVVLSLGQGVQSARPHAGYFQRYAQAYRDEILAFAQSLVTGIAQGPDLTDGLAASEIAEAALLSQAQARPVRL